MKKYVSILWANYFEIQEYLVKFIIMLGSKIGVMGKGKIIRIVFFSAFISLLVFSGCSPMSKSKKRNSSQVCLDYFNFVESSSIKDENVKKREKTLKKINKERAKTRK